MVGVLGFGACDEAVKVLHLDIEILHLLLHHPHGFRMDGFGGCLDRGAVLVCGLKLLEKLT
jgi:hypothetical protein